MVPCGHSHGNVYLPVTQLLITFVPFELNLHLSALVFIEFEFINTFESGERVVSTQLYHL